MKSPLALEERAAEILRLLHGGMSQRAIAKQLGVSIQVVSLVVKTCTPQEEIPVPAWVLSHHREDYRIIAIDDGEEAAASWARNAKKMERQVRAFEARV